jgi:hypothetical protein
MAIHFEVRTEKEMIMLYYSYKVSIKKYSNLQRNLSIDLLRYIFQANGVITIVSADMLCIKKYS